MSKNGPMLLTRLGECIVQSVMSLWRYLNRAPEVLIAFLWFRCWDALKLVRSYLGFGLTKFPLQVEFRDGFRIELTSLAELKVLWHVFVRKCYSLPSECQNIVDAGGNVGIFAIYAASQCPNARIFSLEPSPSTFRALCSNIERNDLQHRVRPIQLGLSSTSGTCAMSGEATSTDRRIVEVGSAAKNSFEWVPVVTLQEFMARQDLETIDFLKMDIEGSEWSVILSSPPELWRRIRHVQLEYHEVNAKFGYHPQMLLDHLGRGGHSVIERTEDAFHTGMIRSTFGRGEACR